MESTTIKSETLTVKIKHAGAEVSSVLNKEGLEFMWQADKAIWPRHAPVLFPIVGKVKDNKYQYNGQSFELGQHGFARDNDFKLIDQTNNSCIFELRSSGESRKNYPFDFIFQIHYKIKENELITTYKTVNEGSKPLLFSVGAHPGFNCPLLPTEKFEDYYLLFETNKLELTELDSGLRSLQKKTLELKDKKIKLSSTLFDKDALVFENRQINSVTLASEKSSHSVKIVSEGWPYFGIWSKKSCTKFVCLEPWFGIADRVDSTQELTKKDGIITLLPGKEHSCSYSTIFN